MIKRGLHHHNITGFTTQNAFKHKKISKNTQKETDTVLDLVVDLRTNEKDINLNQKDGKRNVCRCK